MVPIVILHLDMDAFFAAIEVRDDPALAGKPLIVGHRGRRGVVTTCSYEARAFGIRSAMPSVTAERLCAGAIWLPPRMQRYAEVSRRIRAIIEPVSPLVEPLSIDEAFVDLTGIARDLEDGRKAGLALKERIRREERLTASVGVAPNKFLAKIASDLEKPDGLVVFPLEDVPRRLWPMPVRRLWGVGPKTAERLGAGGLRTVGDLLRVSEDGLAALVGRGGAQHLRALARGDDDRPVVARQDPKSVSEERTYGEDLTDPDEIDRAILARSEGVARELRCQGLVARTVHIKVRTGDFTTWTRALTLPSPTDLAEVVVRAAREMYGARIDLGGRGVRLLGVGVSGIEGVGTAPSALFGDPREERARRASVAADEIRERLGSEAMTRARLLPRRRAGKDAAGAPGGSDPPAGR